MSIRTRKNIHVKMIKHLRESHRLLGIWLAAFMIFFAVTGILINHGNQLAIDQSKVKLSWLHSFYGLSAPTDLQKFALEGVSSTSNIFVLGKQVWLNNTLLFNSKTAIVSASTWQDFIVVVNRTELHMYTKKAELVDIFDESSDLPSNLTNFFVDGDTFWLANSQGIFQSDDEFYSWQPVEENLNKPISWIKSVQPSESEQLTITEQYKSQMLTWERVLLDLHSGRIFGEFGVLFVDLVAILLTVLSLTGIYMWVRQARAKRK